MIFLKFFVSVLWHGIAVLATSLRYKSSKWAWLWCGVRLNTLKLRYKWKKEGATNIKLFQINRKGGTQRWNDEMV